MIIFFYHEIYISQSDKAHFSLRQSEAKVVSQTDLDIWQSLIEVLQPSLTIVGNAPVYLAFRLFVCMSASFSVFFSVRNMLSRNKLVEE